jgi:hypothetical protein
MDNSIIDEINKRLDIGITKYGHEIRINDDTRQFGTQKNSWLEMMEQELLDAAIYLTANIMRNSNIENDSQNLKLKECLLVYKEEHILMSHIFYLTRLCRNQQNQQNQ